MNFKASNFLGLLLWTIVPVFADQKPYDLIEKAYTSYMSPDDPLAFSMKIKSLSSDPYKFWRGSKDLFYLWCKQNASDWLADEQAYLPNHGDLHLGNIGTYAAEGKFGELAFGMVDFDDSGRLPFQFELMQGLITLHLTAEQNGIAISDAQQTELAELLFQTYRNAVNSRRNATNLLADDAVVKALLEKGRKKPCDAELQEYLGGDGAFRALVHGGKAKLKEILRPADQRADEFAEAIARAMNNSPEMKTLFKNSDPAAIRRGIKGIVQRTRLGSSGSQGLKKYFILLDEPLRDADTDIILYLKQEIPSAAERSGIIRRDIRTPGQRCAQDMAAMTDPRPYLNSWCDIGEESYWVHFKEPWSDELEPEDIKSYDDLLRAAKIWATVAGATHREEGRFEVILPRLTGELLAAIRRRADDYAAQLQADFAQFKSDQRVIAHVAKADATIDSSSP